MVYQDIGKGPESVMNPLVVIPVAVFCLVGSFTIGKKIGEAIWGPKQQELKDRVAEAEELLRAEKERIRRQYEAYQNESSRNLR